MSGEQNRNIFILRPSFGYGCLVGQKETVEIHKVYLTQRESFDFFSLQSSRLQIQYPFLWRTWFTPPHKCRIWNSIFLCTLCRNKTPLSKSTNQPKKELLNNPSFWIHIFDVSYQEMIKKPGIFSRLHRKNISKQRLTGCFILWQKIISFVCIVFWSRIVHNWEKTQKIPVYLKSPPFGLMSLKSPGKGGLLGYTESPCFVESS